MRYVGPQTLVVFLALTFLPVNAWSQVESVQPRSLHPGATTELMVRGKNLTPPLRIDSSLPQDADLQLQSVDANSAKLTVTLPENAPLGPAGIWIATTAGSNNPAIVIVDDLSSTTATAGNHAFEAAQPIETQTAIEGTSDGGKSDFFKFSVQAKQRVAFEVLTQQLHSPMDPVIILYDAAGNVLHRADDSLTGPDLAFEHQFASAGEYFLEIHDSRYAAGGAYYLRVGDFPLLKGVQPLAVQIGSTPDFNQSDVQANSTAQAPIFNLAKVMKPGFTTTSAQFPDGKSSQWFRFFTTEHPVYTESQPESQPEEQSPLNVPCAISGELQQPGEEDKYSFAAAKGQTIRISSLTRSLDCPTLLQMQLFNTAGTKVAETPVSASDEWTFDYAIPEDGIYELKVRDLLKRGGQEFGYVVTINTAPAITIALKPDAATQESFPIEQVSQDGRQFGACVVPLQIGRFGYDGPIDVALVDPPQGLKVLNPQIPASTNEALIYIHCTEEFAAEVLQTLTLSATASTEPAIKAILSSLALHRVKVPHVPFPYQWNDGRISMIGAAATEPWFNLEPTTPLRFPTHARQHTATLTIKRLQEAFKTPVTLLPQRLPAGWSMQPKQEGDTLTLTFSSPDSTEQRISELPLLAFAQHAGRGRITEVSLPIEWYQPVDPQLEMKPTLIAGKTVETRLILNRRGPDAQPVTIRLLDLPAGIMGPAEPITIAAEANEAVIQLTTSPELAATSDVRLKFEASGQHAGAEYSISRQSSPFKIIALPEQITIYPSTIQLTGMRDRQRIVVLGSGQQTDTRDWTRDMSLVIEDPTIAELRDGVVHPLAVGETALVVQHGPVKQSIPVQVSSTDQVQPIAFENEVLVALSKQGCNSGACHGSPSGKGGFRLSLRAFDKKLDELTLLREDYGRRLNLVEPEKSLLLEKPLMKVPHGGGKQIRETDAAYKILKTWIAEGASSDLPETTRCVRLEVFPGDKTTLDLSSGSLQLAATAHFADGTASDVTHLVAYESTNNNVATVNAAGLVEAKQRGEAVILVRYLEHIRSIPLMFVDSVEGFQWKTPPENNYIDRLVNAKLAKLQYLPAPTCTDSEFIRRVYLDVIGILPSLPETQAFLADQSSDKRARLIDALLERAEYAKFWALKWGDLLKTTSKLLGNDGVYKYHRWVENAFHDNLPYDQFARHLLTASGSTLANPPANFYRTAKDMNECVENISQVFLGARLQCAKCHNHPFEHWTQDNYYGLGAFFQRVQRRSTQRPGEMFIWYADAGEVIQPRTGEQMKPWLPEQGSIEPEQGKDRRAAFAEWLVDPANPFFAKIEANRIWSQLFARGIVDPIDDFRASNPPTNESLLEALAQDFVASGYDRKHLLRIILNSNTYQASFQTNAMNEGESLYFSHQIPRLLSAEQLLDAVNHVTGISPTFGHLPEDTRATHLPAPDIVKVDFLRTFGQPERTTVCECEREDESNLGMAIELFNGSLIHEKITNPNNRFRQSLAAGKTVEEVIQELYLVALCRPPTPEELSAAIHHCDANASPEIGLEDVCWALLNRDEFLFQH